MTVPLRPSDVVDRIFGVFEVRGHRHYGQCVNELQHALQTAEYAREIGESRAMIAACLLHDYGNLLHDLPEEEANRTINSRHEDLGANALSAWFPPEVVEPARLHVKAKRYLCWKDAIYLMGLSKSSRRSLMLQGGPMCEFEARGFERNPYFKAALRLRRYDDLGKSMGKHAAGLDTYRKLLESLVNPAVLIEARREPELELAHA